MQPINIWSGSNVPLGAALTNPTELSFRKGRIKHHYPVEFRGQLFPDAEAAYQHYKTGDLEEDMAVMTKVIVAKLQQHPKLFNAIATNGGVKWLERCSHQVGVKGSRWEGVGRNSNFIVCLIRAYLIVEPTTEQDLLSTAIDREQDLPLFLLNEEKFDQ